MAVKTMPAVIPNRVKTAITDAFLENGDTLISRARRREILTCESDFADHSMLLLDGWVALSKTLKNGETQIIDVMLPGDFALVGTRLLPVAACTVEALSDVEYINIKPDNVNGPDTASAHLRELLAASVLTTQSRTSELLLRLGRGSAASRVAYALIEFHTRLQAVGRTKGNTFEFPINQQKLGEFTGLTNVHVCRTLRRFERDGITAHPDGRSITLQDMAALCALADVNLELFRDEILLRHPLSESNS